MTELGITQLINTIAAKVDAMPMKPRPKLKGTSLGPSFKVKDGKVVNVGNPKTPVSAKIAKKRKPKQAWRKATD